MRALLLILIKNWIFLFGLFCINVRTQTNTQGINESLIDNIEYFRFRSQLTYFRFRSPLLLFIARFILGFIASLLFTHNRK